MGLWGLKYFFVSRDIQVLPVALKVSRSITYTGIFRKGINRPAVLFYSSVTCRKKMPQYDMKPPLTVFVAN